MSQPAPTSSETPPAADLDTLTIEGVEQRLAMLRRLAELAMALAEDVVARALAAPPDADPRRDPAQSFAQASRAVRLTLSLEARFEQDLAALRVGERAAAAAAEQAARGPGAADARAQDSARLLAQRQRIRKSVCEVMNREIEDLAPASELLDDLHERLIESEHYDRFLYRPLRESVEAICADLGLTPDWSLWTEDGFPRDPLNTRWDHIWWPNAERTQARRLTRLARLEAQAAPFPAQPPPDPPPDDRLRAPRDPSVLDFLSAQT